MNENGNANGPLKDWTRREFLMVYGALGMVLTGSSLWPTSALAAHYRRASSPPNRVFAVIGDGGWSESATAPVRAGLKEAQVSQIILAGDNLYDPRADLSSVWQPWRRDGLQFPVVAIGNHTPGYAEEVGYFGTPGEHYSYRDAGALFLVLNSDNIDSVTAQMNWLHAQLAVATDTFIFIVFHHPPFTLSLYHRWHEKREFQETIRPMLLQYGGKITAVLCGHEHISGVFDLSGTPMIVAGSSFDVREVQPIDETLDGLTLSTRWLNQDTPSWGRLEVNAQTGEAWFDFVEIPTGRVTVTVQLSKRPTVIVPRVAVTA